MGSHKLSFQCFDAILDDPSLKPSSSYGHRSAASHMSSPGSNRMEPLENRGCYTCVDHQHGTSMTSEASGAYSTPWYHFQTHPHAHQYMSRRPARPEEVPGDVEDHHYHHHRHSRRLVLVKNSDPSIRRTIVLHRRSLRSLGLFMEEVSELMQCLIRKLYTLEGRKVDSVQSLLQCAGILVCVGREPFHPLLLDSIRKNSNDKLPKLNIKSRSSVSRDDKGAKKNVNFGLETKRSRIHPRCDSSNRSARSAVSSTKFPSGLESLPPAHASTCPHAREDMMDDDIEKRVLVNKDGSLSMEMKVRFRLLHDETLHWSTEIKKSTNTFSESYTAHDDACCLSHGSGESCSEVESLSAGVVDETYNTKRYRRHFEERHCQHCCAQCQEYDIWKNPMFPDQTAVRHIRSSSSSASSHRIVCKKASTESMHTMSSEEYTEHVFEKATCIEQTFGQQVDATIKHCAINCCCRQSQVSSMSTKSKSTGSTEQKYEVPEKTLVSDTDENKPDNSKDSQKEQLSVQIAQPFVEDERPVSTVSSSSQILASLKEDQDEEDLDINSSISRASHDVSDQQEDEDRKDAESKPCSATPSRSSASMTHLSPRPPSKASPLGHSKTCREFTPTKIDVDLESQSVRPVSAESATCKDTANSEFMQNDQPEESKTNVHNAEIEERAMSEMSTKSKTSTKSSSELSTCSHNHAAGESTEEHSEITEERSSSAISIKSNTSRKSNKSNVAEVLEQECLTIQDERTPSAMSVESENSKSQMSDNLKNQETEVRTSSVMSVKSYTSVKSKKSENGADDLVKLPDNVNERTTSAMSCKSNISAKSKESQSEQTREQDQMEDRALNVISAMTDRSGDQTEVRASSAFSLKSKSSDKSKMSIELSELEEPEQDRTSSRVSVKSHISQESLDEEEASGISDTSVQSYKSTHSDVPLTLMQPHDERTQSGMSTKSDYSLTVDAPEAAPQLDYEQPGERSQSSMSSNSHISATSKTSEGGQEKNRAKDTKEVQKRASSAISAKSTTSSRSRKSKTTPTTIERSEETSERTPSAMSSKSKVSLKSNKSKVSSAVPEKHLDIDETGNRASSAMSAKSEVSTDVEQLEIRASSAMSAKSNVSETSNGTKMSEVAEYKKLQDQDDDHLSAVSHTSETLSISNEHDTAANEKEERTPSALSTKSKSSVKSQKSKASALAAVDIVAEEHKDDLRSASAMSSKSNAKSVKSEVSDVVVEEPVEGRAQSSLSVKSNLSGTSEVTDEVDAAEDRTLSVMSTKSNASKRSNKSNISEVKTLQQEAENQTEERAQSALSAISNVSSRSKKSNASAVAEAVDKDKTDRAPSAMSGKSHISTRSSISVKSTASKLSEVSPLEPHNTECEDKMPSVMSTKSSVSAKSNYLELGDHTEAVVQNKDKPSSVNSSKSNTSTKSKRSKISHKENEITVEGEVTERALSAMSAKSNSSVRTKTSKVSEIIIDEPNEKKVERASSSRSLKSDVSGRSKKSNASEASPEDVVNENEDNEERTASVLSSLSNYSEISFKSKDSEITFGGHDVTRSNVKERERTPSIASVSSVISTRSNISSVCPEEPKITGNEDGEASVRSSKVLAKSNASKRSKNSLFSEGEEPNERSKSVLSSASVKSKADVEKKTNRSSSQLSVKSNVSSRSKKSKVSDREDHENTPTNNRNQSPVSGHSKVSQAANSNKCGCGAIYRSSPMELLEKDSDHEETPTSHLSMESAKSKISSAGTSSERVLTPTSTSVSIGIVDDCDADDAEKIDEAVSVNSKRAASSETEICAKSDEDLLESVLQMTNEKATQTPEEKPKSLTSAKSNTSDKSKSKRSHCNSTWLQDTNQRDEVTSNVSSKTKNSSANDSVKQSSPNQDFLSSTKASNASEDSCRGISAENTAITGQGALESPDVGHKSQSICSKCSSTQNRGKPLTGQVISPVSNASAVSNSRKSGTNDNNIAEIIDRPNSNISNSSCHLQVNDQKINVEATVKNADRHSSKSNKSCKSAQKNEEDMVRCHSATLSVTSANRLCPSPPKSPKKSKRHAILLVDSNNTMLCQTVPNKRAENVDVTDNDNKSENISRCRNRIGSSSSCQRINDEMSELNPSCLPNASPTEVVNEWLRKIPSDAALCDLGDEYHENFDGIETLCTFQLPLGEENERGGVEENDVIKQNNVEDVHVASEEAAIEKNVQENHAVREDECSHPQAGDELKVLDSSVLVMKVLLSPKIDRCNSLPEVSLAYGRKLSTSAQGLLDCLANLQLLDFGSTDENGKKAKYQEIMSMLKSLWLCDPKDSEKIFEKGKSQDQQALDEEFKARSSSGVDVNSGSTSSGKSSILGGTQAQTKIKRESVDQLTKVQEVNETTETKCESATPDTASRARWTPEVGEKATINDEEKLKDDVAGSDETIRTNDSPRELMETPLSSNKSSGNNPQNKETETDHQEDTSSGSQPVPQRPQLSKRVSQDPDPIWVLNLLNKLEKQFMTHYVNAMDEFKVRWNLDDNEQLDMMICELQDEVRRRIQSSVNRELKKIKGRAGRPRPPKEAMSRESTVQTEQRRRRLKVMRNQSVDPQPAQSEDDYTATGTDFSDQRSDDEYCPCDTCLKKKMASKPALPVQMMNSAPVMMDFDLRRILQIKKSAPNNEKMIASECKVSKIEDPEENGPLEAVKEEDEIEGTDKETLGTNIFNIVAVELAEISDHVKAEQHKEAEENEKSEVKTAEGSKAINIKTAEDSWTAEDETAEESKTSDVKTAEESDTAEDESAEECETNEDKTADDDKTTEIQTAEESETTEFKTAEESETAEDETAEEGETTEVKTAEESETAEDETAEEGETTEVKTAEESETAEDERAEEGETTEVKTAEDSETAEDESAEEGETTEVKTAEESETAEDESAEDGETTEVKTAEESETAEDESAEEGETTEVKTAEESETAEDESAEEGETAEVKTAEIETTEDESTEEGEIAEVKTAEQSEAAEDETAEESETAEDETADETTEVKMAEKSETAKDETAEGSRRVEDVTAEESEAAEDDTTDECETTEVKTAEESEAAEDENAKESETTEGKTAEESETVEDETADDGETTEVKTAEQSEAAEDETAEESETVNDETADEGDATEVKMEEESETAKDETAEGIKKVEEVTGEESVAAEYDTTDECETTEVKTAEESEAAEDENAKESETEVKTAEESETAEDKSLEDGQTAEVETAEEGAFQEECETYVNTSVEEERIAGESDTDDDETTGEVEAVENDDQIVKTKTAEDSETAAEKDDDESVDDDTNSIDNKENLVEKIVTVDNMRADEDDSDTDSDEDVAADDTDDVQTAEGMSAEEKSAVEEVTTKTEGELTDDAGEDTAEDQSEIEEVKETVGQNTDVLSNTDDTDCNDVIELKTDKEVVEEETSFKNEGDVVIDSVDEKCKESGKEEEEVEELLTAKDSHFAEIGESAEGGDEAEDDTEPDMETDDGEHNPKVPSMLQTKQEDDQTDKATVTSFDAGINHNSVYDADVEDSETEVNNQVQDLSSESKSKRKTHKTFKTLINTLTFLKRTAPESSKVREEEEGNDEDEHEVTLDESENAEDSSCVEKDEHEEVNGKEKGKLSDITEDTAEGEDQGNETGNTTKDYSGESEWESSENALEKQFTKSSMESQPGSFDEVLDDQVQNQKVSSNVKAIR